MVLSEAVRRTWNGFFYTGFSGESLGLLRLYFGGGLLLFHISQFESLLFLNPTGAHFYFLEPIWYFDVLGIHSHFPLLSFIVFAVLMIATVTMAIGKWTRMSIALIIICIFYLKGVRDSFTGDVHHRYLIPMHMLFLLLLSKCGHAYSLDERVCKGRHELQEWEASWPIKAMQLYCASFYFWSLIAKLRVTGWAWFAGDRLQEVLIKRSVMWGVTDTGTVLGNPLAFQLAQHPNLLFALSLMTLVLEAGFPLILFVKRVKWRLLFLIVVAGFHIVNFVLLYVGFIFLPIAFLIFFDLVPVHAWLKTQVGRLVRRSGTVAASP
jgi:hypothetical protein